jgi:glycosyltransferase involved in cell wall biosynthesis
LNILQVLTLITPDGAYGGPTTVAVNQSAALQALGHKVTIVAGADGFDVLPNAIDGVTTRLFPATIVVPAVGYAGIRASAMAAWIGRHASRFDIAHIHLARDLVTIPAARTVRKSRMPFVVQTHGMIAPGSHPLAGAVDRLWTRQLLRRASQVLCLTPQEGRDLCRISGAQLPLRHFSNGVPCPSDEQLSRVRRTIPPEVLFLGRLHERKRPQLFVEAALTLLRAGVQATFAVVGPSEGAETVVDAAITRARRSGVMESQLRREAAVAPSQATARMAQASVFVQPAEREPFGMTIVEALALGIPVVICRDGGLAEFVRRHGCGHVVDGTVAAISDAIESLLAAPEMAWRMGQRGREAVRAEFSMERIGRDLECIYRAACADNGVVSA